MQLNTISDSNNQSKYIREYFNSKSGIKRLPKHIYIIDGLISKNEVLASLKSNETIWDRAIAIYPSNTWDINVIYTAVFNNDVSRFVRAFEDGVESTDIYIDKCFVEYLVNNYSDEAGLQLGYDLLDKYLFNKIALYYDLDNMFAYMQNIMVDLYNNPLSHQILQAISLDLPDWTHDKEYSGNKKRRAKEFVSLFILYSFNEVILRGNLNLERTAPGYRCMQIIENIYLDWSAYIYKHNMNSLFFDICGIKDVVFLIKTKEIMLKLCDNYAYNNSGLSMQYDTIAKDINQFMNRRSLKKVFLNQKPANYKVDVGRRLEEKCITGINNDTETELFTLVKESLCITKREMPARDVMFVTSRSGAISYFSEVVGIQLTKTEAEKVRGIARRIDMALIQFENMSNQWNKVDAMNYAHDILNDIDDLMYITTNKDTMLALESLRGELYRAMVNARSKDIKKMRTNIVINYPAGYGPQQ